MILLKPIYSWNFQRIPLCCASSCWRKKKEILDQPVILDEVQKIPHVLDEVHWLIENTDMRFILCGSSARKLKRRQANLLGGRAWRYEMFPLTSVETGEIDLLRVLNCGISWRIYGTARLSDSDSRGLFSRKPPPLPPEKASI